MKSTAAKPLWKNEILGGVTTFFTMAYIIFVNPSILSTPGTGMEFNGVLTATVLLSFSMTLLMGLYARLPFAVAPGMGLNAFFTFSIILGQKVPWTIALGIVFWSGVLFVLTSVTPVRERIAQAIPQSLRHATATGIGIFLTFIGLKNSGMVTADPVTLVKAGAITPQVGLSVAGLFLGILLYRKKSPFAFLTAILSVTLASLFLGYTHLPETYFSFPDFHSVLFKLDIWGALQLAFLPAIVSIFFTDLFDSISTLVGVSQATGLTDSSGRPLRMKQGLIVDAFATLTAGLFGTSAGTAYIESASGIEAGGRTGRSALITALCFLPCLFIAPMASLVPAYATAPILMIVGALMFQSVSHLSLSTPEDSIPPFLTIVMIPLSFSITRGILWGMVAHVVLYAVAGRKKEIPVALWIIAVISAGLIVLVE